MASVDWPGILIGAAIGNLIGGIITYLVSRHYYVRAARSLERETARLQRHTELILRGLEEAGLVELSRNEQDEIVGLVIKLRGTVGAGGSVSGSLTVGDQDDAPGDQE